jgi:hypothetical protein
MLSFVIDKQKPRVSKRARERSRNPPKISIAALRSRIWFVGFPESKYVGAKQNDEIDFKSLGNPTATDMGLSAGHTMQKVLKYPDSG